jgi:stress-induced morphogen
MKKESLVNRLYDEFPNASIDVFDLTGNQDHWEVSIKSPSFQGLSRIQQHQKVMAVFHKELKTGELHALSIKTSPLT